MKVIAYYPGYNVKLEQIVRAFATGIPGAEVREQADYVQADIAVIFGLVKKAYEPTWTKQKILDNHSGRRLIVLESSFVKRGTQWAAGWGGIHGGADFCTEGVSIDRWCALDIKVRAWHHVKRLAAERDGPVVVCGQLPRDTNVQDIDHVKWCQETVAHFQAQGVKVSFRPHPRIGDPEVYGVDPELWDQRKIKFAVHDARCFVIWNSTSGVDALIMGVPVIVCGGGARCAEVSSNGLDLASLYKPDRKAFFAGIGYSQWNLGEMRRGQAWRHLTR